MEGREKYEKFLKLFVEAHPSLIKSDQYKKAQELWNTLKKDDEKLNTEMLLLKSQASQIKSRNIAFFVKSKQKHSFQTENHEILEEENTTVEIPHDEMKKENEEQEIVENSATNVRDTPAQKRVRENISTLNSQLTAMIQVRSSGLNLQDPSAIKKKKKEIKDNEIKLNRLQKEAERQRKRRMTLKLGINKVCQENQEAAALLKSFNRGKTGKPRTEVDQPELLSTIVKIIEATAATDDRRRTEVLRTVKTLDDLREKLGQMGMNLSRSAIYLRLQPKRSDTQEGKRHVQTVPVKLLRPENTLRKKNADRMFAKSFIDDLHEICRLFGPSAVLFLSNDDKARVPLGLAAASLQSPILMHLEYKVRLADHNFVVAQRHKLIPSVYGVCEVKPNGDVSYSGDTFIRIRSGKHDSSNPYTHAYDMRELFKCNLINHKPILLLTTDGASDEAPRYPKPLACAVYFFQELELDVLLHGVNAAGLSAFNAVERRMSPLSHDLAGLVLPHDSFGTHLDSSGKTIDEDLEKKNFFKAAEILSDVWSNTVIDGHPVDSRAVPLNQKFVPPEPSAAWVSRHVRQTRYSLQVVKCLDRECCKAFQTNWLSVFPNRFPPYPAIHKFGMYGIQAVEPEEYFRDGKLQFATLSQRIITKAQPTAADMYDTVPFDIYCPSMKGKLDKGICKECKSYWPSKAAKDRHAKCHMEDSMSAEEHESSMDESEEDAESDEEWDKGMPPEENHAPGGSIEGDKRIPIFDNIFDILQGPFVDI